MALEDFVAALVAEELSAQEFLDFLRASVWETIHL